MKKCSSVAQEQEITLHKKKNGKMWKNCILPLGGGHAIFSARNEVAPCSSWNFKQKSVCPLLEKAMLQTNENWSHVHKHCLRHHCVWQATLVCQPMINVQCCLWKHATKQYSRKRKKLMKEALTRSMSRSLSSGTWKDSSEVWNLGNTGRDYRIRNV